MIFVVGPALLNGLSFLICRFKRHVARGKAFKGLDLTVQNPKDLIREMDDSGVVVGIVAGRDVETTLGWKWENGKVAEKPLATPITTKFGAGLGADKPAVQVMTVPHPTYFMVGDGNEDIAYWFTKMLVESFDAYKDITMAMQWYGVDDCIKTFVPCPYHPGAIKYFKEIGKWSPQLQKNQEELLDRQAKLKAVWDKTVDEAATNKVKDADFSAFWLKNRAEAFPNFWEQTPVK